MKRETANNKRCCVCRHALDNHVNEGDGWRCHSIAPDFYQCECFLRKTEFNKNKQTYNHMVRIKAYMRELNKK